MAIEEISPEYIKFRDMVEDYIQWCKDQTIPMQEEKLHGATEYDYTQAKASLKTAKHFIDEAERRLAEFKENLS